MKQFPVCIVGSVAYDNLMRFPSQFQRYLPGDSSNKIDTCFVLDQRAIHYGGTAANLAIGFKKLGINALIVSKVGEDIEDYCRVLKTQGITTEGLEVIKNENTLAVFIVTDEKQNQITFIHPGAFTHMNKLKLQKHHLLDRHVELVIINPLLGDASRKIAEQCLTLDIPYIFDPGQNITTISQDDLLWCARHAKYFIANEAEYKLFKSITKLSEKETQRVSEMVIVTRGGKGSTIYNDAGTLEIPIVKPSSIIDPTGAGDAYRAGFFTGILRNLPIETCAKMGALAGTYCVEATGAQNPSYTYNDFQNRFHSLWDDIPLTK